MVPLRFAVVAAVSLLSWARPGDDPEAQYSRFEVEGWTVHVEQALLEEKSSVGEEALRLLGFKLYEIGRVVPPEAAVRLQEVPIWIGVEDERHPCACYHPSEKWLWRNGYLPAKARSIDISNASNFLAWSRDQPWMILHELAHAWHHQILGFDYEPIREAYANAKEKRLYDSVLHITGDNVRGYALTDEREYFAELTESFFGTNDMYPFVRSELERHDPMGYAVVEAAWNHLEHETASR